MPRMLWPVWRGTRHLTLVSATIFVVVLPLVMARFNLLTPSALVLNTLLWIPMAFALVTGFGVLVFGWILPPVGALFGYLCDQSLWLLEWCIGYARDVPGSHFWVPGPADWWLAGFYGGMGLMAAFPVLRPPRRWCLALLAGWSTIGFGAHFLRGESGDLDCTFLSVGHGSAVVLKLPSGATMLYDAGQLLSPQQGARTIADCLWDRGVTHLDAIVISHADIDHYNAVPELLKRFSIGAVYVSPQMFTKTNRAMETLDRSIRQADTPIREVYAGDRIHGGDGCVIEVLHPPPKGVLGGDNANSIVLAIEHHGRRILLTGDLETPGLEGVMSELPWDCDVLMAPHHGSRLSDPPGLAAWCTPEVVVVSGGYRSDLDQTADAYRKAGARVLHTGWHGAVNIHVNEAGLAVKGFLETD